MEELGKKAQELKAQIDEASRRLKIADSANRLEELTKTMQQPDFWADPVAAEKVSKYFAKTEASIKPWVDLSAKISEAMELIGLNDESLSSEIAKSLSDIASTFNSLKKVLMYSGEYDGFDAIVTISAGVGGTDAQDWAEMLERMYLRFAESSGWKTEIIDRSLGDEAGIKSSSLSVSGNFVYARMKSEHGVHRLVRLSPFNADNLRQTSFAKIEVVPKIDEPEVIEIDEKDLKIDVYRSGGKGGQSVNTTDSAVRITHLPTGLVVAIQNERSQLQNKEMAMTILRSKLAQLKIEQHASKIEEIKGPNEQAAWGNQIRSYVLHPYKMVKDLRTGLQTSDTQAVLDGKIEDFIDSYLESTIGK